MTFNNGLPDKPNREGLSMSEGSIPATDDVFILLGLSFFASSAKFFARLIERPRVGKGTEMNSHHVEAGEARRRQRANPFDT